jgi:hypothetical protein
MNHKLLCSGFPLVLTLLLAGLSWSQAIVLAAHSAVSETEPLGPVCVKVPVHLNGGYLAVVEGSIGNIQTLNFLVDTGAYPSVIDQKMKATI